jgi:Ribbon-helix-helix protein, copG family
VSSCITLLSVRSVRLDPDLEERLVRAAAAEGSTVSEFIREAVTERADRTLGDSPVERLADIVGVVHSTGGRARRTGKAFSEGLASKRTAR